MFFHLEPNNAIINDINVRLINFYRSVQQDFMQLSMELAELENIYSNNKPMTIYGFSVEYTMEEGANNGSFEPTITDGVLKLTTTAAN